MEIDSEQRSYSVAQTARYIGKTELATRRAIERGQLPARRWGLRIVVLRDELEEFLRRLPVSHHKGDAG